MHMETPRLIIRNFVHEDGGDLQEILGDSETMQYCEPAYTLPQTQKFLDSFCIASQGGVAVVCKETNKVIGYILFKETRKGVYEMGWFFNRNTWGRGYALESCKAVIAYAFETLNAHKIFAETIDGVKSVGLMEKLGMQPEGVQRSHTRDLQGNWTDLYLYGLLEQDFFLGRQV